MDTIARVSPCPNCGHVILCGDCGLTRYFAREQAREKVGQSKKWERVVA